MKFKVIIFITSFIVFLCLGCLIFFGINTKPVSKTSVPVIYELKKGTTSQTVAHELRKEGLIRNEKIFLLQLKLQKKGLIAATYQLDKNMSSLEIIEHLSNGTSLSQVKITIPEGKNVRYIAKVIAKNTNYSENDVYSLLKDPAFLQTCIKKYWWIKSDVTNPNLYYSLEGYLYPDTYIISPKTKLKDIIDMMLARMDTELNKYKADLKNSKYPVHQLLTMASLVELESANDQDGAKVASVFYNRLAKNMNLGSDVTTYYGARVDVGSRDLYTNELTAVNAYNTRSTSMNGKLPVGPICSPGSWALKGAIKPAVTNYLYFVADKNKKVYFSATYAEQQAVISNLKAKGLWYTW